MKKSRSLVVGTALLAALAPMLVLGSSMRAGDAPVVSQNEQLTDDLYVAGKTVLMSGSIIGDVGLVGSTITMNGPVSADTAAAGGTVTINAPVGDDLRVMGGTILIQGSVADDVMAAGGTVTASGGPIGGDLNILGGTVTVQSPVIGNINIRGGEVHLNGGVSGNVWINADRITLGPNANIRGTLTYKSPNELTREPGAVVAGAVTYTESPDKRTEGKAVFATILTVFALLKFISLMIGSLIIASTLRRYCGKIIHNTHASPLKEFARGLVTMIVLPVISLILLFTLVGLPFGILGFFAWISLMIFGWLLAPIVLSGYLSGKTENGEWKKPSIGHVATSVLVYSLIGIVPIIGGLVQCIICIIAIGATLEVKYSALKEWR